MIGSNAQISHMDPYIFPQRMEAISRMHGVAFIDLLPALKSAPNAGDYRVDGHPTGSFHELLTRILIDYFRKRGSLSIFHKSSRCMADRLGRSDAWLAAWEALRTAALSIQIEIILFFVPVIGTRHGPRVCW